MYRAAAITLVLMGGGVAAMGTAGYELRLRHERACQAERAVNPGYSGPDCQASGSASGSGHSGGGSSSGAHGTSSVATSARGGFGAAGSGHGGGGGE